jgi:hypothetical protein
VGLAVELAREEAATAAASLRLSAATFGALAAGSGGLSGLTLANASPALALLVACMLTSIVQSTNVWRNASNGSETGVGRGRHNSSCASLAKTRSESVLACPPLVRRRESNIVRAASYVVLWVRLVTRSNKGNRRCIISCSGDRDGPADNASMPSLIAALV